MICLQEVSPPAVDVTNVTFRIDDEQPVAAETKVYLTVTEERPIVNRLQRCCAAERPEWHSPTVACELNSRSRLSIEWPMDSRPARVRCMRYRSISVPWHDVHRVLVAFSYLDCILVALWMLLED